MDTLLGTLFPDFTDLETALFWCKSLEIVMRILAAVLLIGVASEAWAASDIPTKNVVLLVVLAIIGIPLCLWIATLGNKAAADPENTKAANLENLVEKLEANGLDFTQNLGVKFYRQSGTPHKELGIMPANDAVKNVITTFKRAKIEVVEITIKQDRVRIWRATDNGRVQEGKRVGGVELLAVDH